MVQLTKIHPDSLKWIVGVQWSMGRGDMLMSGSCGV